MSLSMYRSRARPSHDLCLHHSWLLVASSSHPSLLTCRTTSHLRDTPFYPRQLFHSCADAVKYMPPTGLSPRVCAKARVLNWLRLWGARVATVLPPPGCSKASNTYLHQNRETHTRGVNGWVALKSHEAASVDR